MDLTTSYCGLTLPHPLVAGASPLVDDLALVDRLSAAGVAAIVMHSLFEEQIHGEALARERFRDAHTHAHAEAGSYLPEPGEFRLGPDEYLERLRQLKARVDVPVIGSLNGSTTGTWLAHAHWMEAAGADALELNLYDLVTDFDLSSQVVEERARQVVREVCARVKIPVAVKLSPFYTALPRFAASLVDAGARGLVLFNRFYQADIDPGELEVVRSLRLSERGELLLRLRWLAVLSGRVRASLAASGGVHDGLDAVKALMAGADCVQLVSALLDHGPEHLASVRHELVTWLEGHEYASLAQLRGSMDLTRCPDPRAFERANYIHVLQGWRAE